MNLKVSIEGLNTLKKLADSDAAIQTILPDISTSILKFNTTLNNRVDALFNTPYSLDKVRIGRTVDADRITKTLLRFSLQYQDVPVTLDKYPIQETESSSISSAPTRIPPINLRGFVKWHKGKHSKDYKVSIRKGKYKLQGENKIGSYAFQTPRTHLLLRRFRDTWDELPTKGNLGIRSPRQVMYGPSLASLAASVLEKDSTISRAYDKMFDEIAKAYIRYYE